MGQHPYLSVNVRMVALHTCQIVDYSLAGNRRYEALATSGEKSCANLLLGMP